MESNELIFSIDEEVLEKVVRTTQAIEGYEEAPLEVKEKVEKLSIEHGIKVSA